MRVTCASIRLAAARRTASRRFQGPPDRRPRVEQVVLDAHQHGIEFGHVAGMQPGDADRRIGLVDRAIGIDAQVVLQPPRAGDERGGAVVAGAGIDLVEPDHLVVPP